MNGYFSILYVRVKALLKYRASAFAGILTQLFWGLIHTMIFTAFYQNQTAPITLEEAISFIWINQALLQLIPWSIDKEIEAEIRSGNVAYELVRPLNLYWVWFMRAYALRVVPTLLRSGVIFVFAGLFFGLLKPVSLMAGVLFFLSCLLSSLLAAAITTIVLVSLFWTISGEGIQRLMPQMTVFLSGLLVPLPLFPEWLQPFMNAQPFRGVLDIPCRIYTGVIAVSDVGVYLAFQMAWATFFLVWGYRLMQRALQKVAIQGG